jgi:hypothetical protein
MLELNCHANVIVVTVSVVMILSLRHIKCRQIIFLIFY